MGFWGFGVRVRVRVRVRLRLRLRVRVGVRAHTYPEAGLPGLRRTQVGDLPPGVDVGLQNKG